MRTSARGSGQTPPCLRRDWRCRDRLCEVLEDLKVVVFVEVSFKQDLTVGGFGNNTAGLKYLKNQEVVK
jgi:hypothetical protein